MRQPRAGHRDDHRRRVRRVVHRREPRHPLPLVAPAVTERVVEPVRHVVEVLALAVDEVAKVAGPPPGAAVQRRRVVVARLARHMRQAGLRHQGDDPVDLLERWSERHRAVDVLAGLERRDGLRTVEVPLREDRHRVDIARADLLDRAVRLPDPVPCSNLRPPLRHDLGERHVAHVRVCPEKARERGAEAPAADDPDLDAFRHEVTPLLAERSRRQSPRQRTGTPAGRRPS